MACDFKRLRRVEFAETDMAGIVHFANFFRMMEETEHAFFRSLGLAVHGPEETTVGWPRVSVSCEYTRPLRFEEEVEIHLVVAEVRARSIRYEFIFRTTPDGAEVARGRVAAVCAQVEKKSGQLVAVPVPAEIRAQISAAPPELLAPAK